MHPISNSLEDRLEEYAAAADRGIEALGKLLKPDANMCSDEEQIVVYFRLAKFISENNEKWKGAKQISSLNSLIGLVDKTTTLDKRLKDVVMNILTHALEHAERGEDSHHSPPSIPLTYLPSNVRDAITISSLDRVAETALSNNEFIPQLPDPLVGLVDQFLSGSKKEKISTPDGEKEKVAPLFRVLSKPKPIVLTTGQKVTQILCFVFTAGIWRWYQNRKFEKALLVGDIEKAKLAIIRGSKNHLSYKILHALLKQPNYMPQLEFLCAQSDGRTFFGMDLWTSSWYISNHFWGPSPSQYLEMLDLYLTYHGHSKDDAAHAIVFENWRSIPRWKNYLSQTKSGLDPEHLKKEIGKLFEIHGISETKMDDDRRTGSYWRRARESSILDD